MDLTRDALEFVQGTAKPNTIENNGMIFSDKKLHEVPIRKYPEPLLISTLSSLVDYIKSGVDLSPEDRYFVVISDQKHVKLLSNLHKDDAQRSELVEVFAQIPEPRFDTFRSRESFQIELQTRYEKTDDREMLLKFISSVQSGTVSTLQDDGVSQRATVSRGAHGKTDVKVPSPVVLQPYRTFIDLEQPASPFIFRLSDENNEVYAGLWEADGGAWRVKAVASIKDYLHRELGDLIGHRCFILG